MQKLFRIRSKGPTVLFYHGVEESIIDTEVQRLHMPLRVFEKQIAFLRSQREVISMDDLQECVANRKRLDPRQVVLTFDDGYKNNARIVAPLLSGWNLPFTLFVSTRHISERRRFPQYYIRVASLYSEKPHMYLECIQKGFDLSTRERRLIAAGAIIEIAKRVPLDLLERISRECADLIPSEKWAELNARFISDEPMDWQDVRGAASMGATIGSHCHDHCILHSNQCKAEVHRQLHESKSMIEENVTECKYLAYPNGTVDDISCDAHTAAKAAHYLLAFTTIRGEVSPDVDRFLMPRIFAAPEYEEFCYFLNRSSKQNKFYRMARLQSSASSRSAPSNSNFGSNQA